MDIAITFPSFVFIPWHPIQLKGMFNGTDLDMNAPIYWVDIPFEVRVVTGAFLCLSDSDYEDEFLPDRLIAILHDTPMPLVLFGSPEILSPIMELLNHEEVRCSTDLEYKVHHAAEEKFKHRTRYCIQRKKEAGGTQFFRPIPVFKAG